MIIGSRQVPGVGIEPTDSCFKGRQHYQQRRPRIVFSHQRVPCGSRTHLASLEGWNLCRSAKGTYESRRKERESNPQGCYARPLSRRLPSPVGLPFRKAAEAGIEPASERLTVAFPYQHRTHRIKSNSVRLAPVRTAGFEPTISCSRSTRNPRLSHVLNQRAPSGSRTHTSAMARQ